MYKYVLLLLFSSHLGHTTVKTLKQQTRFPLAGSTEPSTSSELWGTEYDDTFDLVCCSYKLPKSCAKEV